MDRRRRFGFLLKDVSRLSVKNFERHAAAAELGLTLEQCRVLAYLQSNQGISQARLAYLTETDPMTLVRVLDRMQGDGWLERRRDPGDRRVWRLHLTSAVQPVLRRIWSVADQARAEALSGLPATAIDQLLNSLEAIHANLAVLVPGAVEPERQIFALGPDEDMPLAPRAAGSVPAARRRTARSRRVAP